MAVLAAVTDPEPKQDLSTIMDKVVVQVDIGSGGTRLSVFTVDATRNGGRPEVCKFNKDTSRTSTDALCTNEKVVPRGRVIPTSNFEGWCGADHADAAPKCQDGIAHELLNQCFKTIKEESLNCQISSNLQQFWKPAKVIVTATAGARRAVVAKTMEKQHAEENNKEFDGETDFVGGKLLLALQKAGGMDNKPGGGVIDGSMEAYCGYMSLALKIAELQGQPAVPTLEDYRKNWGFLEIGGASQQFAWWDSGISTLNRKSRPSFAKVRDRSREREAYSAKKNSANFLEVKGDMLHPSPSVFPCCMRCDPEKSIPCGDSCIPKAKKCRKSYTGCACSKEGDKYVAQNKVFATSLLGTGGDRMDIALIKHFMNDGNTAPRSTADRVQNSVDVYTGNTASSVGNPCFVMERSASARATGDSSTSLQLVHGEWLKNADDKWVAYKATSDQTIHWDTTTTAEQKASIRGGKLPAKWVWERAPVASGSSIHKHERMPWDMNVFGDIRGDDQLMAFLNKGGKITNMKFKDGPSHRTACLNALKNIYKKDHSESLDDVGQEPDSEGRRTNPYRFMFTHFTHAYKISRANNSVKSREPTEITHLAVIGKATWGAYGCFEHKNAKTSNFCDVSFDSLQSQGEEFGCNTDVTKFKKFDISACRAVAEPFQMQQEVMPKAKPTFVFIDNDFAQGAAAFAVSADPQDIRKYTVANTFEAESELWTGKAPSKRLI